MTANSVDVVSVGAAERHHLFREGIITGALGATAVALWFLGVDVFAGHPLYTPSLLGAIVTGQPDPIAAAGGDARFVLLTLYTIIHYALFAVVGVLLIWLVHRAQHTPALLSLLLLLFVVFEAGFGGVVALLEQTPLSSLAWYQVALGNLVAALAMGWYVRSRHPSLGRTWGHRYTSEHDD